jgi:hypothetical protein
MRVTRNGEGPLLRLTLAEGAAMLVLMRQEISSAWTVVFKLFVPLILIAISIVLIAILLAYPKSVNSQALIVVSLTLAATAFFVWWSRKLKRVSFDEQNLYVSNLT